MPPDEVRLARHQIHRAPAQQRIEQRAVGPHDATEDLAREIGRNIGQPLFHLAGGGGAQHLALRLLAAVNIADQEPQQPGGKNGGGNPAQRESKQAEGVIGQDEVSRSEQYEWQGGGNCQHDKC